MSEDKKAEAARIRAQVALLEELYTACKATGVHIPAEIKKVFHDRHNAYLRRLKEVFG